MNYNIQKGQFRLTSAYPRGSWWEFYRIPCSVCYDTGNCMLHVSQDKVACTRVESKWIYGKNTGNPSYIHYIKGKININCLRWMKFRFMIRKVMRN